MAQSGRGARVGPGRPLTGSHEPICRSLTATVLKQLSHLSRHEQHDCNERQRGHERVCVSHSLLKRGGRDLAIEHLNGELRPHREH